MQIWDKRGEGNKKGAWPRAQWSEANSCCWAGPLLTRTNQHESCAFKSFHKKKLCFIMQRDKWIIGSPQFLFKKNNSILLNIDPVLLYFSKMMKITHSAENTSSHPACVRPKNVLERSETGAATAPRAVVAAALAKSPPCLWEKNSAGDTTAAALHTPTPTQGTLQLQIANDFPHIFA